MTSPTPTPLTREARNRLVEQHLPLVPFLARRFVGMLPPGLDLDDLLQEGYLGLMRAVERYDPQKINPATGQPYRFSGYATWWIRERMLGALSTQSRSIALPEQVVADLRRLQGELWEQFQREATADELAQAMQRPPAHILLLLSLREVSSLNVAASATDAATDGENGVRTLADLLVAPDLEPQREQRAELSGLLTYLTTEERSVIVCRYQLGQETRYGSDEIPLPYTRVARQVHMDRIRVKAVEERALRKMRYWAERQFHTGERNTPRSRA